MLVVGPERASGAMLVVFALGFAWSSRFSLRLGNAVGRQVMRSETPLGARRARPSRLKLLRVHGLVFAYLAAALLTTALALGFVTASVIFGGSCLFTVALTTFGRAQRKRRAQS